jgi:UDP-N-acetylglucosamine 2-epimerase (non-hydrolysing)
LNRVKKVAVMTFGRSDYGLLRNLFLELRNEENIDPILIIAGSHFLEKFGRSVDEINRDRFSEVVEIDCISGSSEASDVVQDMSRSLAEFGKVLKSMEPDLVVLLGDRFETLTAASASLILGIPIAHINGGELTLGSFDDSIRHAITKMASIHFVASEAYRNRVLQLGEDSERVHNVGHLGADSFANLTPMSREDLEKKLTYKFQSQNFLVTVHPETASPISAKELVDTTLSALRSFPEVGIIFTHPNPDPGHAEIASEIEKFTLSRDNCVFVHSMGHEAYLSAMLQSNVVVGNSSSGILEAPIAGIPSVDIGKRQSGRSRMNSVRNCPVDRIEIERALKQSLLESLDKQGFLRTDSLENSVSRKISTILSNLNNAGFQQKSFIDRTMTLTSKSQN